MPPVQTVLGPIDVADLGPALVHEHVRISYPGDHLDPAWSWNRDDCIATAVGRMRGLQEHGVRTFVDPCPIELGRDPELMAEVARRSGMNIVCSTGLYFEHIGIPFYWRTRTAEEVAEMYLHEIANGIGTTGIRPGVIKIASGDPPTEQERKVIAGAAIAAVESGLPIVSHCENSVGGDVQQEVLAAHGVDLARCVIGHQDQAPDPAPLLALAERGSLVGIDRVGFDILAPDAQRIASIKALIDGGHASRVALSQDHSCCLCSPKFPYPIPPGMEDVIPMVNEQMWGRPHTYLFTDFWPKLEAAGVARATFDAILTENPMRLFGG
jgi:phosphotriesterase-related protein